MDTALAALRYALRQFRLSPVFTAAAILTLSVGIGGTTAIFTLIHAVMLRSLPVGNPDGLYRIGVGNNCCVQGGPQDRWGMFSFPLHERLVAEAPEFEGTLPRSRRPARGSGSAAIGWTERRGRSGAEFVTGNYLHDAGRPARSRRPGLHEGGRPAVGSRPSSS